VLRCNHEMSGSKGRVLVVGGAGYVGSAVCAWLLDRGYSVTILDNLTTGHRELVLSGARFVLGQTGDRALIARTLSSAFYSCVMHFAAKSIVPESVEKPQEYEENNVHQTKVLIEECEKAGIQAFVFSSTAAVLGTPATDQLLDESAPCVPITPYGQNKLDVENHLKARATSGGIRAICLRYFNAAGAESQTRVGEWHYPETHLIPRILQSALEDQPAQIFGTDYPTRDGTCIRDYVHVSDLAQAHEAAMTRLLSRSGEAFEVFHLGSGNGYSVREVINECRKVTGLDIQVNEKPRRAGDPPFLVASSARAKAALSYSPSLGLSEIISSAWDWERKKRASWSKKAVFLDRDGTINEDPGYLSDPALLKLLPGVREALSQLRQAGFQLVVVSNQSGVSRGLIKREVLSEIHAKLDLLLGDSAPNRYELCLHHPDEACDCRKPEPKLLIDAAASLGIDLSQSFMVGDKQSDVDAGFRAGCRGVGLVRTGDGARTESNLSQALKAGSMKPSFIGNGLPDVVRWILSSKI
jgi:UDP-glucose 4-epimerase